MHWCYKIVDSTLICHFSLAFGLGRSANPLGSIFAIALVDSSLHAALVLRAHLLHCMGVNSLLLAALRLLKNLGLPLRHHCRLCHREGASFDLMLSKLPSWKVSFASSSSSFLVTKEGFMLPLLVVISLITVVAHPSTRW